jgi:hypothetical protein
MFAQRLFLFPMLLLAPLVGGCSPHVENDTPPVSLGREDADMLVVIGLDLSGSFADRMAEDGKGYEFTMRVADNYFRNSIGTNNRIVIAQLSGNDRALLWDGTPVQLRQSFPTAREFREFLRAKSVPAGSRIHDGVSDALDYVLSDPGVASGKTRCALFIASDFDDNAPNSQQSEQKLAGMLKEFGKKNGVAGFYFLEQTRVPVWRKHLAQSGIKNWICESEIVAYPPLPTFE